MIYKYGEFTDSQMKSIKKYIRGRIFFLLLIVDPETKDEYRNINVVDAFDCELRKLGGLNSILSEPPELVTVLSLLEAALIEYTSDNFNWRKYRKLILDAGNEVSKIQEV